VTSAAPVPARKAVPRTAAASPDESRGHPGAGASASSWRTGRSDEPRPVRAQLRQGSSSGAVADRCPECGAVTGSTSCEELFHRLLALDVALDGSFPAAGYADRIAAWAQAVPAQGHGEPRPGDCGSSLLRCSTYSRSRGTGRCGTWSCRSAG
jgi:hypothetical protein